MDKKEKIIHAAMTLLARSGMQATPMSAIASEAGTGMGTIYNYFSTKEQLINAIYIYIKQDQMSKFMSFSKSASFKTKFDELHTGLVQYLVEHPVYFHYLDQFQSSPVLTVEARDEGLKTVAPVVDLFLEGQTQGSIKSVDIREMLEFLDGSLMSFVRWVLFEQVKLTDELLANQRNMAWDAVKK